MLYYRILTYFILILSPIIIIYRIIKKKEDLKRFKEKFCFFSIKRKTGKVIWFHGASVGELQSILPILEKYEKDNNIKQILVTSNTLSSSKILKKSQFKKVVHQFFPLDINFMTKKFLNYWKPSKAIFIDSEIWPNMILNLNYNKIPIILLNGRITNKTFIRWKLILNFAKNIFNKIDLCLTANSETRIFLKKLGAKKIKYIGNLKYSQSEKQLNISNKIFLNYIKSKKVWCAASTHFNEEEICGKIHKQLKKKHINLLTVIIPRHINRNIAIKKQLTNLNLKVHLEHGKKKIAHDTDIYLVNSYGKTKFFYDNCRNVFLGGSIINHGGQNPLEAARQGCKILHGKNISNFREIYEFLNKKKISVKINSIKNFEKKLHYFFLKKEKKLKFRNNKNEIKKIGQKILEDTLNEIGAFSNNVI